MADVWTSTEKKMNGKGMIQVEFGLMSIRDEVLSVSYSKVRQLHTRC